MVIRSIDLSNLPRKNNGNIIDWKNSIGYIVNGTYESVNFEFKILDYEMNENKKSPMLTIDIFNKIYKIKSSTISNCYFGDILKDYIETFKYNIGDKIIDEKRDLVIIDRKRFAKRKYLQNFYKIKCNKCGFESSEHYYHQKYISEYWILEERLLNGTSCPCCCSAPQIVVENINSIVATDHWMIPYFQGGYDEAKKYTFKSEKKIYPICPDCKKIKETPIRINTIQRYRSISCICKDGLSYPNKFMYAVLLQLKETFEPEKVFDWAKNKRYDFWIDNSIICEVHGVEHYGQSFVGMGGSSLKEVQENDRLKEQLSKENGITTYISIDARKSDWKWIRKSILNSEFAKFYDLSKIDWLKCHEIASKNIVKLICDMWNDGKTVGEITTETKFCIQTIIKYLQSGNVLGWCNNYNRNIAFYKGVFSNYKSIICIDTGDAFLSGRKTSLGMLEKYNFYSASNNIIDSIKHKRTCKGYTFKYIDDLTEEEKIKYNVNYQLEQQLLQQTNAPIPNSKKKTA